MYVIGTAGHVDHGKSTLVKALTGIDPDRLQEEKEREMTIDLGFAWLRLPSGNEVSIVDVPGHERFIKNMLAGVGGIDLALLVVAADEGVMPQTREHLAILDLLQIKRGIAVLTKKDLVDKDWLELVKADVEGVLKETTLAGSPIASVSAVTKEGLPELVSLIDQSLKTTPAKKDLGRPRLPIDRSFTISGFGTVVTGTLTDGRLKVGQEAELVISGKPTRIRGLQTHKQKAAEAIPGSRVAANLTGVSHSNIKRGEVLTVPGWLSPTDVLDVRLRLVSDLARPLKHNSFVTLHTGTSETVARVRLLEGDKVEPGQSAWAQLRLSDPLAVVKGDFFVIRSPEATLGGGTVIDPHPKRHKRGHAPTLEQLAVMEKGSQRDVLLKNLELAQPVQFKDLVKRANLSESQARDEVAQLASERLVVVLGEIDDSAPVFSAAGWSSLADKAQKTLATYHSQFPLRKGMPKEELKSRLQIPSQSYPKTLELLVNQQVLFEDGAWIRLPDHQPKLTDAQQRQIEEYLRQLDANPYSPSTDLTLSDDLLNFLADEGKVVRVSEAVAFSTKAYNEMVSAIVKHIGENGTITVAQVRDKFNTSRKYALALMEHLDQKKITRRVGDERVMR